MKRFILLLAMVNMVYPRNATYKIKCFHEFDVSSRRLINQIEIDSKPALCFCGKPPVFVFISFGKLDCYCLMHARLVFTAVHEEEFDVKS